MSTHWGYRCETCDEDSPTWLNHGDNALRDIAANWSAIKAVSQIPCVKVEVIGDYDHPHVLDFIEAHEGHAIVLRNEYGDIQELPASLTPQTAQSPSSTDLRSRTHARSESEPR
jgi:hypothetical protein